MGPVGPCVVGGIPKKKGSSIMRYSSVIQFDRESQKRFYHVLLVFVLRPWHHAMDAP